MRHILPVLLVLFLAQSSHVAAPSFAQPFGPPFGPRAPAILNGCSESALFAILNSDRGRYCLENALPRFSNVDSRFTIACSGNRWGCCIKGTGLNGCKVEGVIPSRPVQRPPATANP